MANGSSLTNHELGLLGVIRTRNPEYGSVLYTVPCAICGGPVRTRQFTTDRVYKCRVCKDGLVEKRNAKIKAEKEKAERILADGSGTDYEHFHRFETAVKKYGPEYSKAIEKARTAIGKFDSMPEVVACVELLHIGVRVIVHQMVGGFVADFCLPDEKVVVEIDGSLYHNDPDKEFVRDHALMHMLGDGWIVRHIPAEALMKKPGTFGRMMRKMLDSRMEP